nr:MAG TPA: hypothetical protein [Bacteriophage sp.]
MYNQVYINTRADWMPPCTHLQKYLSVCQKILFAKFTRMIFFNRMIFICSGSPAGIPQ